ncbi:hypothetical protein ACNOYE_00200 [Nannocystaceae bacterium ST9]
MSDDPLALDRRALFAVVALGLGLAPAAILAAVWELTVGLRFVGMTTFDWIAAALSLLVALVIVRLVVRELSGAIGLRFDDEGVERLGLRLRWDAVREVGSPNFGTLELRDGEGRGLRISTYLFRDRAGLLEWVGSRVGVRLRERTLSP